MAGEVVDVSLANLKDGAVVELADLALQQVYDNIMDINTTGAKREVIIKLSFKPDRDRDISNIDIEVKTKLAPCNPMSTRVFLGKTKDGAVATEANRNQPTLPEINLASVATIRRVGGTA